MGSRLTGILAGCVVGLAVSGALAQNVPSGGNLFNMPPQSATTIWNLQGPAVLYNSSATSLGLALPTGTPGLTINGLGNTVTLNDGAGHFGFFSGSTGTLNLSDITITGGNRGAGGGAINLGTSFTINASGTVTLTNNVTLFDSSSHGGAIRSNGPIVINGGIVLSNNQAAGSGGALFTGGAFTLNSTGATLISGNTAGANGGGLWVGGTFATLNAQGGDITFQGNRRSGGSPNAIYLSTTGATLNLSADAGRQIHFYDPIAAAGALTVTKTGNGEVVFHGDGGLTTTYDSTIQATTTVQGGSFTLADGVNYGSAAAGTFTVTTDAGAGTAGTLRGGDNSSLRALTIVVANGGTVAVTDGTFTLNSSIINVQDGGRFSGNGTLAASSNINIAGRATADIQTGDTLTIAGMLAGSGGVAVQGGGILTLAAGNTYSGATTINGGTLQAGIANAFASSSAVTVNAGATLDLNNFSQMASNLSGAGAITLGTATLTADNSATDTTFSGIISGDGALNKTGAGMLTLTGDNSYSGGTTISGGTLQIGDGGTSGSIAGNVLNDGALVFNRSDSLTLAGAITGSGSVNQIGSGTTTLTGLGSSVGAVNVQTGTLALAQTGVFTATRFDTQAGATTSIGGASQLVVTGAFTQVTGSTLNVTLSAHDDLGRHAADRRWRHQRLDHRQCAERWLPRLQPLRQPDLRRRHHRQRLGQPDRFRHDHSYR